jgi:hypothetical protein
MDTPVFVVFFSSILSLPSVQTYSCNAGMAKQQFPQHGSFWDSLAHSSVWSPLNARSRQCVAWPDGLVDICRRNLFSKKKKAITHRIHVYMLTLGVYWW